MIRSNSLIWLISLLCLLTISNSTKTSISYGKHDTGVKVIPYAVLSFNYNLLDSTSKPVTPNLQVRTFLNLESFSIDDIKQICFRREMTIFPSEPKSNQNSQQNQPSQIHSCTSKAQAEKELQYGDVPASTSGPGLIKTLLYVPGIYSFNTISKHLTGSVPQNSNELALVLDKIQINRNYLSAIDPNSFHENVYVLALKQENDGSIIKRSLRALNLFEDTKNPETSIKPLITGTPPLDIKLDFSEDLKCNTSPDCSIEVYEVFDESFSQILEQPTFRFQAQVSPTKQKSKSMAVNYDNLRGVATDKLQLGVYLIAIRLKTRKLASATLSIEQNEKSKATSNSGFLEDLEGLLDDNESPKKPLNKESKMKLEKNLLEAKLYLEFEKRKCITELFSWEIKVIANVDEFQQDHASLTADENTNEIEEDTKDPRKEEVWNCVEKGKIGQGAFASNAKAISDATNENCLMVKNLILNMTEKPKFTQYACTNEGRQYLVTIKPKDAPKEGPELEKYNRKLLDEVYKETISQGII